MKSRTLTCIITMMLFAEMAIPVRMSAQEQKQQKKELPRYTITELGTLGGTFSEAVGINNKSSVIGFSTLPGDRNVHSEGRTVRPATLALGRFPRSASEARSGARRRLPLQTPMGKTFASSGRTLYVSRSFGRTV